MIEKLIEQYKYNGVGYNPYLIKDEWQVAKLNPLPGHGIDEINFIETHYDTDEAFILLKGTAVLIAADRSVSLITFEVLNMKQGVTYNLPKGVWHNIAMKNDAELIIVEKSNTHVNDCTYLNLNKDQQKELHALVIESLK